MACALLVLFFLLHLGPLIHGERRHDGVTQPIFDEKLCEVDTSRITRVKDAPDVFDDATHVLDVRDVVLNIERFDERSNNLILLQRSGIILVPEFEPLALLSDVRNMLVAS